jgi:glycosyltransferase involved in cell wall biosynthesis
MLDDVICFSHLRWSFVYQRPNHLMSRCARTRRVFFFEEPVYGGQKPQLQVTEVESNLFEVVPHVPVGIADVENSLRGLVNTLILGQRLRAPLLWFYTPMALAYGGHLSAGAIVYDCMDELSAFAGAPPEMTFRERQLFGRADLVFTGGESLYEAKRNHHSNVHSFPSSVEVEHFARALRPGAEPEDQRAIGRPRIGFFGVIDERMDCQLLASMADRHPEWHLVLVGPVVKINPSTLPRRPNIHYLGQKTYRDLPDYIRGWDVATIPFAQNESTRFISPTKTLEYLAAGRPVVSTPIRDVARPYVERGIVRMGAKGDFIRAVEDALAERGSAQESARRAACDAFIASTSWDETWTAMEALVRRAHEQRRSVA